jgi:hypothetical protein
MRLLAKWPRRWSLSRTVAGTRLVQMAESGELKMATRGCNAACSLAVSAAETIVRLPTAGREA